MTFSRTHFSTIIKYIGIAFITGGISHGFFSGTRSVLSGVFGIICFILGTLLEKNTSTDIRSLLSGAFLAIGIGAVTGGLQHFPDSPERSLWIIPLGFIISLFFFAKIEGFSLGNKEYRYIIISSIVTLVVTLALYLFIAKSGLTEHTHISNQTHNSIANIASYSEDPLDMNMRDMGNMLMGKSGDDLDKAFLEGMIPHHEGAIEMAKYLSGSSRPELRQLGEEIISAQEREINLMKQWLKEWNLESESHFH